MVAWTTAGPALTASFLASLVEVVEAFTIVLTVATARGIRPAALGTLSGVAVLALMVLAFGPMLDRLPLNILQLSIGLLLLLFGSRWLRKSILRAAGIIPLHDEELAYIKGQEALREQARRHARHLDFLAGLTAFKAVIIEGLEVAFIVVAVGAGRGLLLPASLGALAALCMVMLVGILVHRPLSRVPENTLKFCVGVMLCAFGVFWTGEGLGVPWPGADLALLVLIGIFFGTGWALTKIVRIPAQGVGS